LSKKWKLPAKAAVLKWKTCVLTHGIFMFFFDFVATYFQTHPSQLKNISHHAASGAPHPVESRNVASEMARALPRNWWSIETLVTSAIILRHLLNHALKPVWLTILSIARNWREI